MKKLFLTLLSLIMLLSVIACGNSEKKDANTAKDRQEKSKSVSGDVIKAEIPGSWCFVSGTDMNGANGSDFICHAKKYELGDPYLQVTKDDRSIEKVTEVLESEEIFGKYYGSFELNGNTWYIAENAATALVGENTCLVRGYECDFSSDEVRSILGTIQWNA